MASDGGFKTAVAAAWDSGARLLPRSPAMTVLYFHAVTAEHGRAFEAQIAYLKRTSSIVSAAYEGPLDTLRPNVAVTFDDAFRSVRDHALPVLIEHNIPVTVFVPTGWTGREPAWSRHDKWDGGEVIMSLAELAALPPNLVTLGSHSVDHLHLSRLTDEAIEDQLARSRATLEGALGRPVDLLSLPYGDYDKRVVELAVRVGYRFVFSDRPQMLRQGGKGPLRGRTAVDPTDDLRTFALKSRGAFAWMPAAVRVKAVLNGELQALSPGWRWQQRYH